MSIIRKNVTVVVLGDIGRSPRMQYHCLSLAEKNYKVDLIGYGDTDPMDAIKQNPLIFHHYMLPLPTVPIRLLNFVVKTILQALNLLFLLAFTSKTDFLLMQNPPAIPSMLVCWFYARIVGAKFIIDWHNYGHTIMALNVGERNPLVKLTKQIEQFVGGKADANFCVTIAMKKDLRTNWNIDATVLYDRPPEIFHPLSLDEKHEFLLEFSKDYPELLSANEKSTQITEYINGQVQLKAERPGILISSTSWTEDEDFSILLNALAEFEQHYRDGNVRKLPKLLCIITGKGAMQKYYLQKMKEMNFENVVIITPWLKAEDYPKLLACADLGVCLHTSSSGLDLPMKVVDMFGCGLPVCAHYFNCINELVQHEKNSYVFKSAEELSKQIFDWFDNFPNNQNQLTIEREFKKELEIFQSLRWKENWELNAHNSFV